jgi:hypothetical protein
MHAARVKEWDEEKNEPMEKFKHIDDVDDGDIHPYGFRNVKKMSFNTATRNADSYGMIF